MRIGYILITMLLISKFVYAQPYYVDPVAGLDTNPGTITQPLKTLAVAIPKVGTSGGYVYLRGGTYTSGKISLSKTATASSTIKIWAYGNENPIIDFSGAASNEDGFSLSGNYYHFKGLEIIHAPHNAIKCTGNNNIFEACKIHSNGNTGLAIGSSGSTYPSNNLILNCDSYLNYDAPTGEDADGFSAKWNIGTGNVFKGCRAWRNSDDGWDLWMAIATVEIDSCFAFDNGVNSWGVTTLSHNNGNGFKLGGNDVATHHIVKNCVSFDNAGDTGRGFDENNNLYGQTLYNCVAYRNFGDNYHFTNNPITGQHIIKNCISYIGNVAISNAVLSNNSWPSLTPVVADFLSIDTSLASAPRQANGNLANNGFFRLAAGSKFIDAGVNVGIPFMGVAPDIGAFEYAITNLCLTAFIEGRTSSSNGQMISDTVTCVIKNGSVPFATVDSAKVSLNTNGQGTVTLSKALLNMSYYIAIRHRNSIETWSNPVTFSTSNPTYDFTTSKDKAYGNNLIQVGSKWCLYSGDVNQDGFVTGDDFEGVDNDAADFDYHLVNDLNGDGFVTGDDFQFIDNNASLFVQRQVPAGAPGFSLKANNSPNIP